GIGHVAHLFGNDEHAGLGGGGNIGRVPQHLGNRHDGNTGLPGYVLQTDHGAAGRGDSGAEPASSSSARNSRLPAGPSKGDSVTPRQASGGRAATKSSSSRSTRWWTAGSVMTPFPRSASALPASNCGFINATMLPDA